jgi:integrase/recombinase XerD
LLKEAEIAISEVCPPPTLTFDRSSAALVICLTVGEELAKNQPLSVGYHAGVDINTIRAWLGQVSLEATNIYAETNLEMKAKALAMCEIEERKSTKRWREDPGLMTFLRSL